MEKKKKNIYIGLGFLLIMVFITIYSGLFSVILGLGQSTEESCAGVLDGWAKYIYDDGVDVTDSYLSQFGLSASGNYYCTPCSTEFGDSTHYNAWCFLSGTEGAECIANGGWCETSNCLTDGVSNCQGLSSDSCSPLTTKIDDQNSYVDYKISCYDYDSDVTKYSRVCKSGYLIEGLNVDRITLNFQSNLPDCVVENTDTSSNNGCSENSILLDEDSTQFIYKITDYDDYCDDDVFSVVCKNNFVLDGTSQTTSLLNFGTKPTAFCVSEGDVVGGDLKSLVSVKDNYVVNEPVSIIVKFTPTATAHYVIEAEKVSGLSYSIISDKSYCDGDINHPSVYQVFNKGESYDIILNFNEGFDKIGVYKINVGVYKGCSVGTSYALINSDYQETYDSETISVNIVDGGETTPCNDGFVRVDGVCKTNTNETINCNSETEVLIKGKCYPINNDNNNVLSKYNVSDCPLVKWFNNEDDFVKCDECVGGEFSINSCPSVKFMPDGFKEYVKNNVMITIFISLILLMIIVIIGDKYGLWNKIKKKIK